MRWHEDKLTLDLDRDRIHTVLRESYETCRTVLGTSFDVSEDEFVAQVDPYLESNRVTIPVNLPLPCQRHQGMSIEVNLRRAKVICRMSRRDRRWQIELNRYITNL